MKLRGHIPDRYIKPGGIHTDKKRPGEIGLMLWKSRRKIWISKKTAYDLFMTLHLHYTFHPKDRFYNDDKHKWVAPWTSEPLGEKNETI